MIETRENTTTATVMEQLDSSPVFCDYRRLETVLVVEDQEELNRALSLRLMSEGLNVVQALDGMTGLEKIRDFEPDVIVLDLKLPRLHGFKLLHALRTQPNLVDAPIVVMTGDPNPELEARAERWGIRKFFRKPVSHRVVVGAVLDELALG